MKQLDKYNFFYKYFAMCHKWVLSDDMRKEQNNALIKYASWVGAVSKLAFVIFVTLANVLLWPVTGSFTTRLMVQFGTQIMLLQCLPSMHKGPFHTRLINYVSLVWIQTVVTSLWTSNHQHYFTVCFIYMCSWQFCVLQPKHPCHILQ